LQKCDVFNNQNVPLNISILKDVCEYVISKEKVNSPCEKRISNFHAEKACNINLVLVDNKDMMLYNKYRNANGSTDVLSFKYELPELLGEVYVCPEYVRENARYFKVPFGEEMVRVCIHGVLHLFDYDHEKSDYQAKLMFEKQEGYVLEFSDSFDNIS